jgi:sulfur-oxidizing protein SoxY
MNHRRQFMQRSAGLALPVVVTPSAFGAEDKSLEALVRAYTNGAATREGRVKLDIATLVDNGNSVPITVTVDSPMTAADHVVSIAVFNEKNPEHDVAQFTLSAASGRARVATRIRLAMTQKIVAAAKMRDGSCWTHTVDVLVTLAACIEE